MEVWKDITDFEGIYQISNQGRVKSLSRPRKSDGKILKERILRERINTRKTENTGGYAFAALYNDEGVRKYISMHQLVARHFIDNPNGYTEVNHINGIKLNNDVTNLEWCDHAHNMQHAWETGLISASGGHYKGVRCIETGLEFKTTKKAVEYYGLIDSCAVSNAANPNHHQKRAGGYHWEYI